MKYRNFDNKIANEFLEHLRKLGISDSSLKYYKSDFLNFSNWITKKVRSSGTYAQTFKEALPFLHNKIAAEYKDFLKANSSLKTTNRRLSTLRQLSRFLLDSQILSFDIMEGVNNEPQSTKQDSKYSILSKYKEHLRTNKVSANTIKNYISDIKQFISWIDSRS